METRKIQKLGSSTLAISLPAEWTKQHGVEKGEEIQLEYNDGGPVMVIPESSQQDGTEATIHAEKLGPGAVERAIIAQYVLGRRVIRVTDADGSLDSAYHNAVYGAETQLMGLSVIKETPEQIAIRCSVDPEDFVLDHLLERLESAGRTMRNGAIKALAQDDPDLAHRALNREQQANKIFVLLLRLIFSAHGNPRISRAVGLETDFPLIGYRSIAKNLELTADNAQNIAQIALDREDRALDVDSATMRDIRNFNELVDECMEKSVEATVDRDYDLAMEVRELFAEIKGRESDTHTGLQEMPNEERLPMHKVFVYLEQTAGYGTRNAEIIANLALTRQSEYVSVS